MSKLIISPSDKSIVAEKWNVPNDKNPVRNTDQDYLHFINTNYFSEEAINFLKRKEKKGVGYYTDAPEGTRDYDKYWDEQERRCLEGYIVGGVRITGRHYFYLNFSMIKATPLDLLTGKPSKTRKILTFPRFLDMDYYFFHELERVLAEGKYKDLDKLSMAIAKSRRKGFTYKISGGVYAYNYNFFESSMNILAAYEKDHFKVTLDGIHYTVNHLNKYTDWAKKRQRLNKRDHFRASLLYKDKNGQEIEDGYMSEINAVSFKDNPFKGIGESADILGFEEAGKFNNLLTAYQISEPLIRDGDFNTGSALIWGTGGDMEGGTRDFYEIFYNPTAYGFRSYENIYDEKQVGECGWFVDDLWYLPGQSGKIVVNGRKIITESVDENGNSYRDIAEVALDAKRATKKKGSRLAYNKFKTQQPKTPSEAFMRIVGNRFDADRANARIAQIENTKSIYNKIRKGKMIISNGEPKFVESDSVIPLHDFPIKGGIDKTGCVEVYELPYRDKEGKVPYGRYLAGIDPYDDDESTTTSVGSCIILDSYIDKIVAHYKGRPKANDFYEIIRRLLLYYNALANYERNKKGIFSYLANKNQLYLLADEPEILKDRELSKANTIGNNSKGTYGSKPINNFGLTLSETYLDNVAYGEKEDSDITILDRLLSIPLLKEIAIYDDINNFDDVSALGMLMIIREDKLKLKPSSNYDNAERSPRSKELDSFKRFAKLI